MKREERGWCWGVRKSGNYSRTEKLSLHKDIEGFLRELYPFHVRLVYVSFRPLLCTNSPYGAQKSARGISGVL